MQVREAEHGHHRVADELLNGSTVALDRPAHEVEVAREHLPVDLGVEPGGETRRVDEVTEEHRDRAPVGRPLIGAVLASPSASSCRRIACCS